MQEDLKVKIIGYDVLTAKPSELERVVNDFMAMVQVKEVQVVTVLSNVIIHVFYYGEEPMYAPNPTDSQ